MTIDFNAEKIEVLETRENESYKYEKVKFKENGMTIRTRVLKESKLRSNHASVIQLCLNDVLEPNPALKRNIGIDPVQEFLKHPAVILSKDSIGLGDDGNYYIDPISLNKILATVNDTPSGSSLDWNVTEPNTLTLKGLLNVSGGAILAGFQLDNKKLRSLAKSNNVNNIELNGDDGSGHLAAGNIAWDAIGSLFIRGKFESNANGNRIIIDPVERSFKMIDENNREILSMTFYNGGNYIYPEVTLSTYTNDNIAKKVLLNGDGLIVSKYNSSGQREKEAYFNTEFTRAYDKIIFRNLPTSTNGLEHEQLWNDNGYIRQYKVE